ncbi:MAG TPA: hypothetical protein VNB94_04440 [Mycobacteriales bacterium]|nr:hypothetical protein [Mycobacteriales bacterium]
MAFAGGQVTDGGQDVSEKPQCPRAYHGIVDSLSRFEGSVVGSLSFQDREAGLPGRGVGPRGGGSAAVDGPRRPQRPAGFPEPSAQEPVPRHRVDEPQREIGFALLCDGFQSAAQVGSLGLQPFEPVLLLASAQLWIGPFGERDVVVAMPLPQALELTGCAYAFEAVGGDGFE